MLSSVNCATALQPHHALANQETLICSARGHECYTGDAALVEALSAALIEALNAAGKTKEGSLHRSERELELCIILQQNLNTSEPYSSLGQSDGAALGPGVCRCRAQLDHASCIQPDLSYPPIP